MADSSASFIPKNRQRVEKRVGTTRRIYLLSYLSYVIFFGTLIAVVGTYFYAIQVKTSLDNSKAALEAARLQFNSTDLDNVRGLEKRLLLVNELLQSSVAPSKIFGDIETVIAENIVFNGFKFEQLANKQYSITLEGKADDFNQILYQRDLMNRSPIFESAEIVQYDYSTGEIAGEEVDDSLLLPEGGNKALITFVFNASVDGPLIPYVPKPDMMPSDNVVTSVRSIEESTGTSTDNGDVTTSGN